MLQKVIKGLHLYYSMYSAPCRAVLLTLKTLDLELEAGGLRSLDILKKFEQFEPWFEQINYERVVPTIVDNGYVLWESRVISKYLVKKYATPEKKSLYPPNLPDQCLVDRALSFDQGILNQSIVDYCKPQLDLKQPPNPILGAEIERSLQLLERMIGTKRFVLAGMGGADILTIADFSILASLSKLESMDYSYDRHEGVTKYVDHLRDFVLAYRECCQEGINQMKEWNRKNLNYMPQYLGSGTDSLGYKHITEPRI